MYRTSWGGLDYQRAPAGASVDAERWVAYCEGYMAYDVVVRGVFDVIAGFLSLCLMEFGECLPSFCFWSSKGARVLAFVVGSSCSGKFLTCALVREVLLCGRTADWFCLCLGSVCFCE